MNTEVFDSSFFGYTNLPDSIEFENRKLIPLKRLKLRYLKNCMSWSPTFSASCIREICQFIGIKVYRPVKGLYCIGEDDCKFFDYLYQTGTRHLWYEEDYRNEYHKFSVSA